MFLVSQLLLSCLQFLPALMAASLTKVGLGKGRGYIFEIRMAGEAALLLLATLVLVRSQLLLNSIATSSATLSAPATYTLQLSRLSSTPVTLNSALVLAFSNDYLALLPAAPACSSNDLGSLPQCSWSGTTLSVAHLFSNSSYLSVSSFSLTISNITNPFPAGEYIPIASLQIVGPTGAVSESGAGSASLTITPASALCNSSIINPYVFQTGQVAVRYSSNFVPVGGTGYNLSVQMSSSYPDDQTATAINPSFTLAASLETGAQTLVYRMPFANSLTITMLLPPSTRPANNFITISAYQEKGIVDSCSITLDGILPNSFALLTTSPHPVQTTASMAFNLKLATPLLPSDTLQIQFDSAFGLTSLSSTVSIAGYGSFTLGRMGSLLSISSIVSQAVLGAQLLFSLTGVGIPFTTSPVPITLSLATADGYYRSQQTLSYQPSAGALTGSVSCGSVQIGVTTTCTFALKTSSSLAVGGSVFLTLPTAFKVDSGSQPCSITGSGLNSQTTCIYFATNNSIQIGSLTSGTAISPMNASFAVPITISQDVGNYSISVGTLSTWVTVDSGKIGLSTSPRVLKNTEFVITSSSNVTYSPTVYTVTVVLPFTASSAYSATLTLPFQSQFGATVTLTGGTLLSFSGGVLLFSSDFSSPLQLSGLLTARSLAPTLLSLIVSHSSVAYFTGNITLTATAMKTLSTFSLSLSNQVVASSSTAALTITELQVADRLVITANYSGFWNFNQSVCTGVVSCSSAGAVKMLAIDNLDSGLTGFNVGLINLGFVGRALLTVTVYDSSGTYGKLTGSVQMVISVPNSLNVSFSQTNPYLTEATTYTFTLSLHTSSATSLQLTPSSSFSITSAQCILNCGTPVRAGQTYLYPISSTSVVVSLSVTNPTAFDNSSTFSFKSGSSQGDMDFGQATPSLVCPLPCRSCTNGTSICLSCYLWAANSLFFNSTCLPICPALTYQINVGGLGSCLLCDSKCAQCSASSTNCSSCLSPYFYYAFACYTSCPAATYPSSNICLACPGNCSSCTSLTHCSGCVSPASLFNGSCYSSCPQLTYSFSGICVNCSILCSLCSATNGSCLGCLNSTYLYGGVCWPICPVGVYPQGGICESCQPPCSSCNGSSTQCTSCLSTYNSSKYYYLNGSCYAGSCPNTYYISATSNICNACVAPCLTCSLSVCLSCTGSLLLYLGNCFSSCPAGSFAFNTSCLTCPAICQTCLSNTVCTTCISNYYLLNSTCLSSCPNFYYPSGLLCLPCVAPCALCSSATRCLSCSNSSLYLQVGQCRQACTSPYHPNNLTMLCQICQSPCYTCTWSTTCTSCVPGFSFLTETCLSSCPAGYYSSNSICLTCSAYNCSTCALINQQPSCTSCPSDRVAFAFTCPTTCPNQTVLQNGVCQSLSCSNLTGCIVCSGTRCLQCSSVYTLSGDYSCSEVVTASAVLSALAQIPIPFPFLIASVAVLLVAFFLKHNYPRMFSPLFIYACLGLCEVLDLCLWTALAVLTNSASTTPYPLVSIINSPLLVIALYFCFNIAQLVCWNTRIATDKKYRLWEKQDNRSASIAVTIVSFCLSFRFSAISFSQVGHSPAFSARLSTQSLFRHYPILALLSLLLSAATILSSIYISYLQTSLNFLFFTGLEVAILAVLMTVLSLVLFCVPAKQLLEAKEDYALGYDQDALEGKSIQEMVQGLNIEEEEEAHPDFTGSQVMRHQKENVELEIQFDQDEGDMAAPTNLGIETGNGKKGRGKLMSDKQSESSDLFAPSQAQSESHILIDEIQSYRLQGQELSKQYASLEQPCLNTYPRPVGTIIRQQLQDKSLLEDEDIDTDSLQECQLFTVDYRTRNCNKIEKGGSWLPAELEAKRDPEIQRLQKIAAEEERVRKEEEKKMKEEEERKKEEERKRKEEEDLQRKKKEQEESRIAQQKILQAKLQQMRIQEEQLKLKMAQQQQQQRELQRREREAQQQQRQRRNAIKQQLNRIEIDRLNQLAAQFQQLARQEEALAARQAQLEDERLRMEQKQREEQNEEKERVHMAIEDKLSRTAELFHRMWAEAEELQEETALQAARKTARRNWLNREPEPEIPYTALNYHNDDQNNLVSELSPVKVKVTPRPLPEQYRRQHLYVEDGRQILSDNEDEIDENVEIVWNDTDEPLVKPHHRVRTAVIRPPEPAGPIQNVQTSREPANSKEDIIKVDQSLERIKRQTQSIKTKVHRSIPRDGEEMAPYRYQQIDAAIEPNDQFDNQESQLPQGEHIDFNFRTEDAQLQPQQSQALAANPHFNVRTEQQLTEEMMEKYTEEEDQSSHAPIRNDIVTLESSDRSIHSQSSDTHWPIEPEMKEKIRQIQRRADLYLRKPKDKGKATQEHFIVAEKGEELYEQMQGENELESSAVYGEIVFEQSEQIQANSSRSPPKKRYPVGRVNRRVIDLSPDH